MSYQVLARKYRPKNFETLVGQEHVVRALTHALQTGRLMQFVPENSVYTYFRYDAAKTVMIVLNTANQDMEVDTQRFAERMQGFTKARNVATGEEMTDLSRLKIGKNSPLVLELLR